MFGSDFHNYLAGGLLILSILYLISALMSSVAYNGEGAIEDEIRELRRVQTEKSERKQ